MDLGMDDYNGFLEESLVAAVGRRPEVTGATPALERLLVVLVTTPEEVDCNIVTTNRDPTVYKWDSSAAGPSAI